MDQSELEEQFKIEFKALAERTEYLQLAISPLDAWILLSQIQLSLRHPGNTGPTAVIAAKFARKLEKALATTPALKEVARRGWDRKYDVEADR